MQQLIWTISSITSGSFAERQKKHLQVLSYQEFPLSSALPILSGQKAPQQTFRYDCTLYKSECGNSGMFCTPEFRWENPKFQVKRNWEVIGTGSNRNRKMPLAKAALLGVFWETAAQEVLTAGFLPCLQTIPAVPNLTWTWPTRGPGFTWRLRTLLAAPLWPRWVCSSPGAQPPSCPALLTSFCLEPFQCFLPSLATLSLQLWASWALWFYRIPRWFGLEGTFEAQLVQSPWHGQGPLPLPHPAWPWKFLCYCFLT